MANLRKQGMGARKLRGNEMCAPLNDSKDVFRNRLGEVGDWFRKLYQYPVSEILDKMVELPRISFKPKDPEEAEPIFKKLNKIRKERNRALAKGAPYEMVAKKWFLDLLELQYAQPKGGILANVRGGLAQ